MYRHIVLVCVISALVRADYLADREKFIKDEESMSMGASIQLNSKEKEANEVFMKYKNQEIEAGFQNPGKFPPAMHFFRAKKEIENSMVYKILKQMPKGAALHTHDTSLMSADWLLNVTYRDNLLACFKEEVWTFAFANPKPSDECWVSVKEMRENSTNTAKFDAWIKSKFTLEVENPEEVYKDINTVWKAMMDIFTAVTPMITYRPVFEDYLNGVLERFYNDNVMYMEMRGTLPIIYDLTGWPSNPLQVVGIMDNIVQQFVEDHPGFIGMKFIYGPVRRVDGEVVDEYLQIFQMMQSMFPDFVAGFDLVGQEDLGKPLVDFVAELQEYKEDTKFFFHAGETNWNGMSTDLNLIDAVLLNTTRIGHGYAITKHPKVMEEIKNRRIAIEVNPISNQVLLLVKDIRNHPAGVLLAQDFPVVISSDDPGFWGADPLSHDFYMAFMGMARGDADLRMLKQLAINSIQYSALGDAEKLSAMKLWEQNWDEFLSNVIKQYGTAVPSENDV